MKHRLRIPRIEERILIRLKLNLVPRHPFARDFGTSVPNLFDTNISKQRRRELFHRVVIECTPNRR